MIEIAIVGSALFLSGYTGYLKTRCILSNLKYNKCLQSWRSILRPGDKVMVVKGVDHSYRTVVSVSPTHIQTIGSTGQLSGDPITNIFPLY